MENRRELNLKDLHQGYGADDDDLSLHIGIGFERLQAIVRGIQKTIAYANSDEISNKFRREAGFDAEALCCILEGEVNRLNKFIYYALDDSDVLGKVLDELKRK